MGGDIGWLSSTASRHKLAADINWLPRPYFEISIFYIADSILNWFIIITFVDGTNFKTVLGTNINIRLFEAIK